VGLGIVLSGMSDRTLARAGVETLTLWPRAGAWPSLAATERGLRVPALWDALRAASPGRVLFVRSSVPLVYGTEWWRPHTHVTALTPIAGARPIVNGTFTHPSAVAALVYRGSAGRGAITTLVERLDGESLFGRRLDALDAATLNDHARRLGISVVVALEDDLPRLGALADNPLFPARRVEPPFVMWLGPAAPLPAPSGPGRWRVTLPPSLGEWSSAGVAYYPLWRAAANGRPVATRDGADAQLGRRLPERGGRYRLRARGFRREEAGAVTARAQHQAASLVHHRDRHRRAERPRLGLGRAHRLLRQLQRQLDHEPSPPAVSVVRCRVIPARWCA